MSVMISTQVRRASNFCREQFFERRPRVWGFRTLDETRVASTFTNWARPALFFSSSRRGLSERGEASTADGARRARALPLASGCGRRRGSRPRWRRGGAPRGFPRAPRRAVSSRVPRGAPARSPRVVGGSSRSCRPGRRGGGVGGGVGGVGGALFRGLPRPNHARGGPAAHGRGPRRLPVARGDPGRARGGGRARASAPRAVRVGAQALGARVQAVDPPRAPRRVQGPRRRELPRAPAPVRGERLHHHRARPVPRGARAGVVRPRRGRVPRGHGQGARRPRPGESRRRALGGGARDGARGRDRRRRRASGRGGPATHRSFAPPQCVVVVVPGGRRGEKKQNLSPARAEVRGVRGGARVRVSPPPPRRVPRVRPPSRRRRGLARREALPANRRAFPRRVFTAARAAAKDAGRPARRARHARGRRRAGRLLSREPRVGDRRGRARGGRRPGVGGVREREGERAQEPPRGPRRAKEAAAEERKKPRRGRARFGRRRRRRRPRARRRGVVVRDRRGVPRGAGRRRQDAPARDARRAFLARLAELSRRRGGRRRDFVGGSRRGRVGSRDFFERVVGFVFESGAARRVRAASGGARVRAGDARTVRRREARGGARDAPRDAGRRVLPPREPSALQGAVQGVSRRGDARQGRARDDAARGPRRRLRGCGACGAGEARGGEGVRADDDSSEGRRAGEFLRQGASRAERARGDGDALARDGDGDGARPRRSRRGGDPRDAPGGRRGGPGRRVRARARLGGAKCAAEPGTSS